MSFLVVVCSKCGGLLLAREKQKTRICPYCGFKVELREAKRLASAQNVYEASKLLRSLKKKGFSVRRRSFISRS